MGVLHGCFTEKYEMVVTTCFHLYSWLSIDSKAEEPRGWRPKTESSLLWIKKKKKKSMMGQSRGNHTYYLLMEELEQDSSPC